MQDIRIIIRIVRKVLVMSSPVDPQNHDTLRQGAKQMTDGAAQVASGLKGRLNESAMPAARRAASSLKARFDTEREAAGGLIALVRLRSPQLLILAAGLMAIGLILPLAKHHGHWVTYLTMPHSDGLVVLGGLTMLSLLAAFRLTRPRSHRPLRLTTAIFAIVFGCSGFFSDLSNIGEHGLTPGIVVLGLGTAGIIAMGLITLTDKKDHDGQN